MDNETLMNLIKELSSSEKESPVVEFKINNLDPDIIGSDVSALSNMARLHDAQEAYIIFGIDDKKHAIVGSDLTLSSFKKGNEDLIPWILRLTDPQVSLDLFEATSEGKRFFLMRIGPAIANPTKFKGVAYCRADSYTHPLSKHNDIERRLWEKLGLTSSEMRIVKENLTGNSLLAELDLSKYYSLLGLPYNQNPSEEIKTAIQEHFAIEKQNHKYAITLLGASLFARDITSFPLLESHTIRLVRYEGKDRVSTLPYNEWKSGYAIAFENVFNTIMGFVALPDSLSTGLRSSQYLYPKIAIRESLGNVLIHQDLAAIGQGPLIEVFPNRIEFSNPGKLLIEPLRIVDTPPLAINEKMASFMRRIGIGDAVASGFDKIVASLEENHMPAPLIEQKELGVRLMISNKRSFADFTMEEKIRSTYYHSVLAYLRNEAATNASLRERFGLDETAKYQITRLIKLTMEKD